MDTLAFEEWYFHNYSYSTPFSSNNTWMLGRNTFRFGIVWTREGKSWAEPFQEAVSELRSGDLSGAGSSNRKKPATNATRLLEIAANFPVEAGMR